MDFEQLLALQTVLDIRLHLEQLTWAEYEREFFDLLQAAGYTWNEYVIGIDRRWDYLHRVQRVVMAAA